LYRDVWGSGLKIARLGDTDWPEEWDVLDKALGIDTLIHYDNGMMATIQEKFLSHKYACFRSLTVAYKNQYTGRELSWFKLACQFYFVGYEDSPESDQFGLWAIVNWPSLLLATQQNRVTWRDNKNRAGYTAAFRYCIIDDIPSDCIVMKSNHEHMDGFGLDNQDELMSDSEFDWL